MKTTNSKSAKTSAAPAKAKKAAVKKTVATKPAAPKQIEKPVEKSTKPLTTKSAAKTKATAAKPVVEAFVITNEQIALRAYFIGEQRHREHRHGNSHQDWLEAERQLTQELADRTSRAKTSITSPKKSKT